MVLGGEAPVHGFPGAVGPGHGQKGSVTLEHVVSWQGYGQDQRIDQDRTLVIRPDCHRRRHHHPNSPTP